MERYLKFVKQKELNIGLSKLWKYYFIFYNSYFVLELLILKDFYSKMVTISSKSSLSRLMI